MTQQDSVSETIDGETYRVRHIDPLTAMDITVDLGKLFAPVFAAIGGTIIASPDSKKQLNSLLDGETSGGDGNSEAIERSILGLFSNLSKDQVRFLIDTMTPVTEVKKGTNWPELGPIFPIHFRGKPASLLKWLAFAMRVNFKDFFSSMGAVISRAGQQLGQGQ